MISKAITIRNQSGLHTRPAGVFVKMCQGFKSDIQFDFKGQTYNAKGLLKVLGASVKHGDEILLRVEGEDEQLCMDTLVSAIEGGLGEKIP